jgi:hypothetical protein
VSLSDVTDPASSSGHIVRVRSCKAGANVVNSLTGYLMQGSTQICSFACHVANSTWTTTSYTLSSAEADAITDYTDLRVRVALDWGAGVATGARVSWIEFECPDAAAGGVVPVLMQQYRQRRG